MLVEPVTLPGRTLRLEPLGMQHAESMWRVATPDIFTYHFYGPEDASLEAFQAYIERILGESDRYPFAIVLNDTGDAVGTTSFMDVRPAHRGLEIGSTWIGKPYQGTH